MARRTATGVPGDSPSALPRGRHGLSRAGRDKALALAARNARFAEPLLQRRRPTLAAAAPAFAQALHRHLLMPAHPSLDRGRPGGTLHDDLLQRHGLLVQAQWARGAGTLAGHRQLYMTLAQVFALRGRRARANPPSTDDEEFPAEAWPIEEEDPAALTALALTPRPPLPDGGRGGVALRGPQPIPDGGRGGAMRALLQGRPAEGEGEHPFSSRLIAGAPARDPLWEAMLRSRELSPHDLGIRRPLAPLSRGQGEGPGVRGDLSAALQLRRQWQPAATAGQRLPVAIAVPSSDATEAGQAEHHADDAALAAPFTQLPEIVRLVAGIQRKAEPGATVPSLPRRAQAVAEARRSLGQTLGRPTRRAMEAAFSADFSTVRIHADAAAAGAAALLSARAFTLGSDIYFARGAFEPASPGGLALLGHELAHTIQQPGVAQRGAMATSIVEGLEPPDLEEQAVRAEHALMRLFSPALSPFSQTASTGPASPTTMHRPPAVGREGAFSFSTSPFAPVGAADAMRVPPSLARSSTIPLAVGEDVNRSAGDMPPSRPWWPSPFGPLSLTAGEGAPRLALAMGEGERHGRAAQWDFSAWPLRVPGTGGDLQSQATVEGDREHLSATASPTMSITASSERIMSRMGTGFPALWNRFPEENRADLSPGERGEAERAPSPAIGGLGLNVPWQGSSQPWTEVQWQGPELKSGGAAHTWRPYPHYSSLITHHSSLITELGDEGAFSRTTSIVPWPAAVQESGRDALLGQDVPISIVDFARLLEDARVDGPLRPTTSTGTARQSYALAHLISRPGTPGRGMVEAAMGGAPPEMEVGTAHAQPALMRLFSPAMVSRAQPIVTSLSGSAPSAALSARPLTVTGTGTSFLSALSVASRPMARLAPWQNGLLRAEHVEPARITGLPGTAGQRREGETDAAQVTPRSDGAPAAALPFTHLQQVFRLVAGIQRKAEPAASAPALQRSMATVVRAVQGAGQPLDGSTRRTLESALGADFTAVRVHTDDSAAAAASTLAARAFTLGSDIFFARDAFQPSTTAGLALLGHELVHTMQRPGLLQRSAVPGFAASDVGSDEPAALETQATHAETTLLRLVAPAGIVASPQALARRTPWPRAWPSVVLPPSLSDMLGSRGHDTAVDAQPAAGTHGSWQGALPMAQRTGSGMAVATEARRNGAAPMLSRAVAGNESAAGPGLAVRRQAESDAAPLADATMPAPQGGTQAAPASTEQHGAAAGQAAPNVDDLASQVLSRVKRQLALDHERSGGFLTDLLR